MICDVNTQRKPMTFHGKKLRKRREMKLRARRSLAES